MHLPRQDASFGTTESVKLSGVKRIDTTGFGVNKVTLSIRDVIDMTDYNNRLVVIGDKGDTVNHWPWRQQQLASRGTDLARRIGCCRGRNRQPDDDPYQLSEAFRRTGNLGLMSYPRGAPLGKVDSIG